MTAKKAVFTALKSRKWHSAFDLIMAGGGVEATRRVRELRAEGYPIKTRNIDGEFQYRMTSAQKAAA